MLRQNSKHLEIKYCQIKDLISRYNFWQSKQILTTNCMNIKPFEDSLFPIRFGTARAFKSASIHSTTNMQEIGL